MLSVANAQMSNEATSDVHSQLQYHHSNDRHALWFPFELKMLVDQYGALSIHRLPLLDYVLPVLVQYDQFIIKAVSHFNLQIEVAFFCPLQ